MLKMFFDSPTFLLPWPGQAPVPKATSSLPTTPPDQMLTLLSLPQCYSSPSSFKNLINLISPPPGCQKIIKQPFAKLV